MIVKIEDSMMFWNVPFSYFNVRNKFNPFSILQIITSSATEYCNAIISEYVYIWLGDNEKT